MKNETKQKIKEFYEKRKLEIITGSLIIGAIIIACILKPKPGEIQLEMVEVEPDWAIEWKDKCNQDCLLYESGLEIFADDEQTIIYKDALDDGYSVRNAELDGFTVIDRA